MRALRPRLQTPCHPDPCYAAGLRISEAVQLKTTDVDSRRTVIRVEEDVMLSFRLFETLRTYWKVRRPDAWLSPAIVPSQPIIRDAARVARRCRFIERP